MQNTPEGRQAVIDLVNQLFEGSSDTEELTRLQNVLDHLSKAIELQILLLDFRAQGADEFDDALDDYVAICRSSAEHAATHPNPAREYQY